MTLVRRPLDWSQVPFRNAMDRPLGEWPPGAVRRGLSELPPPLDVRETDDAYIVEVTLLGVDPDDTEVSIDGRTVMSSRLFGDGQETQEGTFLLERRRGQVVRAVALPGLVEVDRVTSKYENGELTITLPKAVPDRARRANVPAGNGRSGGGRRSE